MSEKIIGSIRHLVFRSESTSFSVYKFACNDKVITITGNLPILDKRKEYCLTGEYDDHPKYGFQFKVIEAEEIIPKERDLLVRYLSGPDFVGIGTKIAEAIVDTLGENCIELITEDANILDSVEKMTLKRKESIVSGLKSKEIGFNKVQLFLTMHEVPFYLIQRLYALYSNKTIDVITENPYQALKDDESLSFSAIDHLGSRLGFSMVHPFRQEATLVHKVSSLCFSSGDTYLEKEQLQEEISMTQFDVHLASVTKQRRLKVEDNRIYPMIQYVAEENIARFLAMFPFNELKPPSLEMLQAAIASLQFDYSITYDQEQIDAIIACFNSPLVIITGGPGTGKTTIIKAVLTLFKRFYSSISIACVAPTGRAAKRLSELTDTESYTIHSLLKWNLEKNTFAKNHDDPLDITCCIIDEFSMVDTHLFYRLLDASSAMSKLIILGDENQLPSVAPGTMLKDLIDCELFPVFRLKQIFRQKEGSYIIDFAQDIQLGTVDFNKYLEDVKFFSCPKEEVCRLVTSVVQQAISKGYSMQDIQVIAPMYQGIAGIHRLNSFLQQILNPPKETLRQWRVGAFTYRENDKILQLKNQPDDNVFNGDIGVLVEIQYPEETIDRRFRFIVQFDDNFVEYTSDTIMHISHAYCISIHKSQGSEYPIVIMPVVSDYQSMLERRLLYTGVTRAKKSIVLLGEIDSFHRGIEIVSRKQRKTSCKEKLLNPFGD